MSTTLFYFGFEIIHMTKYVQHYSKFVSNIIETNLNFRVA